MGRIVSVTRISAAVANYTSGATSTVIFGPLDCMHVDALSLHLENCATVAQEFWVESAPTLGGPWGLARLDPYLSATSITVGAGSAGMIGFYGMLHNFLNYIRVRGIPKGGVGDGSGSDVACFYNRVRMSP